MVNRTGSGVWLLHSTPQFPFRRQLDNYWPSSGNTKGQTFICGTFNYNQFQTIGPVSVDVLHTSGFERQALKQLTSALWMFPGLHLKRIRAFPFEHDIPENFHQQLKDAVNWMEQSQEPDDVLIQDLTSSKGQTFRSFAKRTSDDVEGEFSAHLSPQVQILVQFIDLLFADRSQVEGQARSISNSFLLLAEGDLYVRIAKNIKSNVHVQVWGQQQDEPHGDPGQCVKNVESIKNLLGEWKPKADHSKWCVAEDQNKHWTCVADVNRCITQYQRYGGALCIQDEHIQSKFLQFARVISTCRKRPRPPHPECRSDYDSGSIDLHPLIIDTGSDPDAHMDPPQAG